VNRAGPFGRLRLHVDQDLLAGVDGIAARFGPRSLRAPAPLAVCQ
jgi:hypothetical protein